MDEKQIRKLIDGIKFIEDKNTKKRINIENIEVKFLSSKYSNTKVPIAKIVLNGIIIARNNPYKVCYTCIRCEKESTVALSNLSRKINKKMIACTNCVNTLEEKTKNHSLWMTGKYRQRKIREIKPETATQIIEFSKEKFNKLDSDYIDNYFNKHLTEEEFVRLKPKIISFQKGKFKNLSDFKYIPYVYVANQTMFCPKMYDMKRDVLEKLEYIRFKCDCCDDEFVNRDLYIRKNRIKTFCQNCAFVNYSFKIRSVKNCNGEKISYQSKYELKFVKFCNDNNIVLQNGPTIKYEWKGERRYVVDFCIPKLNLLIELKDNHCWHREQVKNGKWESKIKAVDKFIESDKNTFDKYLLIFPKNYVKETRKILEMCE